MRHALSNIFAVSPLQIPIPILFFWRRFLKSRDVLEFPCFDSGYIVIWKCAKYIFHKINYSGMVIPWFSRSIFWCPSYVENYFLHRIFDNKKIWVAVFFSRSMQIKFSSSQNVSVDVECVIALHLRENSRDLSRVFLHRVENNIFFAHVSCQQTRLITNDLSMTWGRVTIYKILERTFFAGISVFAELATTEVLCCLCRIVKPPRCIWKEKFLKKGRFISKINILLRLAA